jgi:predicted PurR-regulated permease PerM
MDHERFSKAVTITVFVALGVFLLYALRPYFYGIIGALVAYFLFLPLQNLFVKKLNWKRGLAATLCLIIISLIIVIPSFFIISYTVHEVIDVVKTQDIGFYFEKLTEYIERFNLGSFVEKGIDYSKQILIDALKSIPSILINLIIFYFVLFYLLYYYDIIPKRLEKFLPFDKKNSRKLFKMFKNMTHSTILTTLLIAAIQGAILGVGFWFLGVPGAFFWGVLTALVSVVPIIGQYVVWIPAAIIYFLQGNIFVGVVIVILGLFISTIDNFIRPFFAKKIGNTHPLITLFGVLIGIPMFGILGIVIGPLLIAYFLVLFETFREQYMHRR